MKCFFHRIDLDGHCSGAIVKMKYPECEMIGVDYNDKIINYTFNEDDLSETIFIVDFSFTNNEMKWLNLKTRLIWIDHHKSAIEKVTNNNIAGIREIGKAGCELTWEYLYPDKRMPETVRLLGRYDVFDHKDVCVLPFQYGFRLFEDTFPDSPVWGMVLKNNSMTFREVGDIIEEGHTVLTYEKKQNEIYAKGMSYEVKFEGYRAIVINKAFSNSKIFDSVYNPEKHDIMILFGAKPGEFKYSIYSAKDNIDVSKIAIKYGGGGHKGAAGFYSKTLII